MSTARTGTSRIGTTAVESLVVLGRGGDDTITAAGNLAPLTALTLDGGDDRDRLYGGNGADLLVGGPGNDRLDGGQGADRALMGDGHDVFLWDPGDASDVVEGQGGTDLLEFNFFGWQRQRVDRRSCQRRAYPLHPRRRQRRHRSRRRRADQDLRPWRADTVVVDDLTGTDARTVDVYLSASWEGDGDGQADTVIVRGTAGPDVVDVGVAATDVVVSGLAATVRVQGAEPALDTLRIQTLDGDDSVTVAPDVIAMITPIADLGADE